MKKILQNCRHKSCDAQKTFHRHCLNIQPCHFRMQVFIVGTSCARSKNPRKAEETKKREKEVLLAEEVSTCGSLGFLLDEGTPNYRLAKVSLPAYISLESLRKVHLGARRNSLSITRGYRAALIIFDLHAKLREFSLYTASFF